MMPSLMTKSIEIELPGRNILSYDIGIEIRNFGRVAAYDDEFEINRGL